MMDEISGRIWGEQADKSFLACNRKSLEFVRASSVDGRVGSMNGGERLG